MLTLLCNWNCVINNNCSFIRRVSFPFTFHSVANQWWILKCGKNTFTASMCCLWFVNWFEWFNLRDESINSNSESLSFELDWSQATVIQNVLFSVYSNIGSNTIFNYIIRFLSILFFGVRCNIFILLASIVSRKFTLAKIAIHRLSAKLCVTIGNFHKMTSMPYAMDNMYVQCTV